LSVISRSTVHAIACRALKIKHTRTKPYRPRTNGKAERFIRTLLSGWAYGAIYRNSAERTNALSGWLDEYNYRRPHGALSHKPPAARLSELNNLVGSRHLVRLQRTARPPSRVRSAGLLRIPLYLQLDRQRGGDVCPLSRRTTHTDRPA